MAIRDLIPWRRPAGAVERSGEEHPLLRMHREMNRLFDDFFGGMTPWHSRWPSFETQGFVPSLDVHETDNEVRVSVELPGMDEKDIQVELADGGLTISGEKELDHEGKREGCQTFERSYGSFRRHVALPDEIEPEMAAAEFKNGVLTVTIPRPPEAKSQRKRVEVKAG